MTEFDKRSKTANEAHLCFIIIKKLFVFTLPLTTLGEIVHPDTLCLTSLVFCFLELNSKIISLQVFSGVK